MNYVYWLYYSASCMFNKINRYCNCCPTYTWTKNSRLGRLQALNMLLLRFTIKILTNAGNINNADGDW